MEELKEKWCIDLEEILQCPVCFERPQRPIYQCKDGHHICHVCRIKIQFCPLCQSSYNGSRSFLAEDLGLKLDDIKSSILQPAPKEINFATISTQTEIEIEPEKKFTRPSAAKGTFPCRIGDCTVKAAHSRMLNHLRYFHKERLCESTSIQGKEYLRQWEMDHLSNINFDLAFFIPEMGMFFLISSIDSDGNFMGGVQIINTNQIAREFKYKLELKGNNRSCSYEGFPRSCKTSADASYTNSLHVSAPDMKRLTNKDNKVTCVFSLTREIPEASEAEKK